MLNSNPINQIKSCLLLAVVMCFVTVNTNLLYAQASWITDFSELNEEDYHIGANAYWDEEAEIGVLTEAVGDQHGRIYYLQAFMMAIFSAEFDIRIGGGTGADGATFAWVEDYDYPENGGGSHDFDQASGFAIEFDCYNNAGRGDPNGQHIALMQNDMTNHLDIWQTNEGVIEDNQWHHVQVTNFLGHIVVVFDDEQIIDYEIEDYEGFPGYFGFTAGTGGSNNWHVVDNVQIIVGGPEMIYDPGFIEFGPVPENEQFERTMTLSNTAEDEGEYHDLNFRFTDLGGDPDWLSIEPEAGEVAAGQELEITLTANTVDLELGEYDRTIRLETNDPEDRVVDIDVHMFVVDGFGRLSGTVLDAANDQPLEGAVVMVDYFGYQHVTNQDGEYWFENIPAWVYDLVILKEDYLPLWEREVAIASGQDIELNFALLHSVCDPEPGRIQVSLQPDDQMEIPLTLGNSGNGQLTWSAELVFPDQMQIEPLTHRWHYPAAEVLANDRLGGIEFDGEYFYIGGGIRDADNQIYVLNRDGELVNQFPQFSESNYGFRGLAFDGEMLWGEDEGMVFGFTREGDLQAEFESPVDPTRGLAWDSERDLLWLCNVTSDITAMDRNGNVIIAMDRPEAGLHIYGMGFYPDDENGYTLYLFCGEGEMRRQIWKLNPDNGQAMMVIEPEVEGQAGAATVSGLWDPYSWVFIGLTRANPDAIEIWQLGSRSDWLTAEPLGGTVDPQDEIEMTITLNTLGLPLDEAFIADIVITHDGVGAVTEIPVSLLVTDVGGISQRNLSFDLGWNLVSLNVIPENRDVRNIMQPLVDDNLLLLIKDGLGRFYNPEFEFNNIPEWNVAEGYQVKVDSDCHLIVAGEVIAFDTAIPLRDGWQIISYYPRQPINVIPALSGIVDNLLIAKDGAGHFYSPDFGFENMGDMVEGQGYQIKMAGEDELIYSFGERAASIAPSDSPHHFSSITPTGFNMSLLILANKTWAGYEAAAFDTRGCLIGSGQFDVEGKCGLAIWGDDPTTEAVDGMLEGGKFNLRVWNTASGQEQGLTTDLRYTTDDFLAFRPEMGSPVVTEYSLSQNYPNPFNSITRLNFGIPQDSDVRIAIYDAVGRKVTSLVNDHLRAGQHIVDWDASFAAAGVYVVRMEAGENLRCMKIMLLK